MTIFDFCKRNVCVIQSNSTVLSAAVLMRKNHVGSLIVVGNGNGELRRPVGIVTDRDIVLEVIACDLAPETILVEDIMFRTLHTVNENAGVFKTIHLMHEYGVRRLPVIDDSGELVGMVTFDDLFLLLSREMEELSKLIAKENVRERQQRS